MRKFADEIKKEEEAIDILVNNGGVMLTPKEARTKDGFEMTFGVNYLGHFLLTLSLLDKLMQSKSVVRIVNVSSTLYYNGDIDLNDINMENNFSKNKAYGNSKLALILFTRELAKRTKGANIRVYAVNPGNSIKH